MPKDYKHRRAAGRPARNGPSRWTCALTGFALGLCVAVGAYVEGRYPGTILTVSADAVPAPADLPGAPAEVADARDETPRPRFEFYDLLPEMEVTVPVRKPVPPRTPAPEPVAPAIPEAERAARILAGEEPPVRAVPETRVARGSGQTDEPGRVRVLDRVQEPDQAREFSEARGLSRSATEYMVQVASFKVLSDADRMKATLALTGHHAVIQTALLSDNSKRHRVRLGPFASREDASRVRAELAGNGVSTLLVKIDS